MSAIVAGTMNTITQLISAKDLRLELGSNETPISASTLYYWVREGLLPPPIKIGGGRISRWIRAEVSAVIGRRIAGAGNDAIRGLVKDLVAARGSV